MSVNKGRSWELWPIRNLHKFTNQRWRGKARSGRQETEQMTLDEKGQWGGGWEGLGEEKRPWERGVCLLKDVLALLKNLPWHMFCLMFLLWDIFLFPNMRAKGPFKFKEVNHTQAWRWEIEPQQYRTKRGTNGAVKEKDVKMCRKIETWVKYGGKYD